MRKPSQSFLVNSANSTTVARFILLIHNGQIILLVSIDSNHLQVWIINNCAKW